MSTNNKEALEALKSSFNRSGHLIGRTSYRTALVRDIVFECNRDDVQFIENELSSKDNHVVIIFQILYQENGWVAGTYYAFVSDDRCLIGREIDYKEI